MLIDTDEKPSIQKWAQDALARMIAEDAADPRNAPNVIDLAQARARLRPMPSPQPPVCSRADV